MYLWQPNVTGETNVQRTGGQITSDDQKMRNVVE